jgi:hypothetical protein
MSAQTSCRGVLLTVVVGCLLLLSGFVATEDRGGPPGAAVAAAGVLGDRAAGSRAAPAHFALLGPQMAGRPAAGRTVTPTGHRPASLAGSEDVQVRERVGSLDDRASTGSGDHLVVELTVGRLWPSAAGPTPPDRVSAAAVGAPRAPLAARAPPAS